MLEGGLSYGLVRRWRVKREALERASAAFKRLLTIWQMTTS